MEFTPSIACAVVILIFCYTFRKSTKRVAKYAEELIATNANEGMLDILDRNAVLAERVASVDEVYLSNDIDRLIHDKCYTQRKSS